MEDKTHLNTQPHQTNQTNFNTLPRVKTESNFTKKLETIKQELV